MSTVFEAEPLIPLDESRRLAGSFDLILGLPREQAAVAAALQRVANVVQVAPPIEVRPDMRAFERGDFVQLGVSQDGRILQFAPGITSVMPMEFIEGVLAHEMGHVVRPGAPSREGEDFADAFAAKHGYARQLAASFVVVDKLYPDSAQSDPFDTVHPPMQERIEKLVKFSEAPRVMGASGV